MFVKARVAAEMKKNVVYNVDVSLDGNGVVNECQCECGAGMGPEAHCKHVCVILFGLMQFTLTKSILIQQTCTETLQQFHRAKKFTGFPRKEEDLVFRKEMVNRPSTFDPRRPKYRSIDVQSLLIERCNNFSVGSMPINQIVLPANLYAVSHEHDYCVQTPEEAFLKRMNISSISNEKIHEQEKETKGQYRNSR